LTPLRGAEAEDIPGLCLAVFGSVSPVLFDPDTDTDPDPESHTHSLTHIPTHAFPWACVTHPLSLSPMFPLCPLSLIAKYFQGTSPSFTRRQGYRRIDITFPFGDTNVAGWPIAPT
jgi:hypothetical protein